MGGLLAQRRAQMFPKLTPAQIARLELHGRRIETHRGEILAEAGARQAQIFIVVAGSIEVLQRDQSGGQVLYLLEPGDFNGEMSALRGSAGLVCLRVREGGAAIAVATTELRVVVQTDAELSELLMRAFILRRMGLISSGGAEVMLIGSRHSADSLRLREFLTRNTQPFRDVDLEGEPDLADLLARFHVGPGDVPVVICRGEHVFRNPSNHDIAECLGMNPQLDDAEVADLLIIGAGPAGLAAAVYGTSEGLQVRVVETMAPGGQAGTSSRIENYLGFPTGISGLALAGRALSQAQKFGAALSVAAQAVSLNCEQRPYTVKLLDGKLLRSRSVLVASGVEYRTLALDGLARFLGAGVYYAATHLESVLCRDEEIAIVGGGNSAGQAAVFLAASCRRVHLLVRGPGLSESMSDYLVRRIHETPNIDLRTATQIVGVEGTDRLEWISWRRSSDGQAERHAIGHLFVMTGAVANTLWLKNGVVLDADGFVKTGADLTTDDLKAAHWPLPRAPYLMETSLPGVFAAGDVRSGSVKRIASAVGEGSICVQFVHRALRELPPVTAVTAVTAVTGRGAAG
ncbi:MAG TPA: FAD-dependent oxidoreductase [Steroidobacteraceae bacterium]